MSIKILLADDSITIQKVIGIIFGGEDYSLTVVNNGQAAVDKAREIVPDVMLIDALMPGMTGYEACEAIRSTPALAAKPILLLTGSFEPFDENKAKNCGADDFLAKPFESQQIVSKVLELYQQGLTRAATPQQFQPQPELQPFAALEEFSTSSPVEPFTVPEPSEPAGGAASDDIWGAFISTAEPTPATAPPNESVTSPSTEELDVFALINEEPEPEALQPDADTATPESPASRWIPVEEQTFEFRDENAAGMPTDILSEPVPSMAEMAFGDISFEEPAQPPTGPTGPAPAVPEPRVVEPVATSAFAPIEPVSEAPPFVQPPAVPLQLSEEQLKAAIASLSRDMIERIVWEVVPELAETMIKDAIRKIKDGL
jgi:CheY-like chemotaxis protein